MDKIVIAAIPLSVRIGVTSEERSQPQTVLLDLSLELDLEPAANTDDLNLTVNYHALVSRLKELAESGECRLLETMTARLCRAALSDPKVVSVQARVRKFPAEMSGRAESVAVEMTRSSR
jgi:dihydroneopterin aldolase